VKPDLYERLASRACRVAVLKGGMSTERNVSLKSGKAVSAALRSRGWEVVDIDVGPDLPERLRSEGVEVCWIALHGAFGEDGCVQGLLEIMRIPYTGSDVRGSAIAMDKVATKRCLAGAGLNMCPDVVWEAGDPLPLDLGFPLVAKTPRGGSTIGTFVCQDAGSLESALVRCLEFDPVVLIEKGVHGEEITVAVLGGRALPVVSIRPVQADHFDFEAKYQEGRTQYLVPSPLPAHITEEAQRQAVIAYKGLGLAGVARADFLVDGAGQAWFLEINTIPGMTATSLSPMAAGAVGMSFEDLVEALLQAARCHQHPAQQSQMARLGEGS
jgi:D-alanine-D-alanine ligase